MGFSWLYYLLCLWAGIEIGYYFGRKQKFSSHRGNSLESSESLKKEEKREKEKIGEEEIRLRKIEPKPTVILVNEETGELEKVSKEQVKEQYITTINEIKLLRYGLLQYTLHSPSQQVDLHPSDHLDELLKKLADYALDKPFMWNHQKWRYIWPDLLLYFAQGASLPSIPWRGEISCKINEEEKRFEIQVDAQERLYLRVKTKEK